jgi:site-specific recombinase XerD
LYRPETHKTEHHGRQRIIAIGPKAQDVLRPYLLRAADQCCFMPAESERKRLQARHAERRTPLSYGNRPGSNRKRRPKTEPGDRYTTCTYRQAIRRTIERVNRDKADDEKKLPKWAPNQLRHSTATAVRRQFGLEAAQVTLGHATADVTQVYAERDLNLATEVMRKIG